MADLASTLLPVVALIALGYVAVRTRVCPTEGVDGIMAFVTYFAVPCLLMRAMFSVSFEEAFDVRLIASFYLPVAVFFFGGIVIVRWVWRRTPGDCVAISFATTFGNTVMLGIPVVVGAYGEYAVTPLIGIVGLHAAAMYCMGITMMEGLRRDGAGFLVGLARTVRAIVFNSILIGITLGVIGNLAGVAPLPKPLDTTLNFLADAAIPLGLFSVGAALARYRLRAEVEIAAAASLSKLVLQPAATFATAHWIFGLDSLATAVATTVAAMPLGMNSYLFANMYSRGEAAAASSIVLSNLLALFSVSVWLLILG